MFRKLVSQLSLSPAASQNLAYYARRLRQERVTRTFSALAVFLLIGLQVATIIAPATPVNAASPNDVIFGGITSKRDLLSRYDSDARLRQIFARFDIRRGDIAKTRETTISSRERKLMSLGRVHRFSVDKEVQAAGETFWLRPLYLWDTTRRGAEYRVLAGTRADGSFFAVMFDCGNIVVKEPPAQPKTPPPPPPPPPPPLSLACVSLRPDRSSGIFPLTVAFNGRAQVKNQTVKSYTFDFGDGTPKVVGQAASVSHTYARPGTYTSRLFITGSSGKTTATTPACSSVITVSAPPAKLSLSKAAVNITRNTDATRQPAVGGESIRYTLTTRNSGGQEAKSYQVKEDLTDVLEYATLVETGGGTLQGTILSWPTTDIKAGGQLVRTFTVTVKSPVPATPTGISDRNSYDLKMDNVYGNDVRVEIEAPAPKQIEQVAHELPATGPGASLLATLIFSALVLYFFARNRQLIAEIKVLRADHERGIL